MLKKFRITIDPVQKDASPSLGLGLSPTFVAFTPWTSLDGYLELLAWLVARRLVDRVTPIQLSLRLLIPPGSRLLALSELRERVGPLDPEGLMHPWVHPDPVMDALAEEAWTLVEESERSGVGPRETFHALWRAAHRRAGREAPALRLPPAGPVPARLSEPWYCCAEPTRQQVAFV